MLQLQTLRVLTIILEVEGATDEVKPMSNLPSNEFLDPIFEKEDLIEGFKVIWFVINNFFVSFEISGGSYNLSQNTLRLINGFEKYILSLMESLIANFLVLLPNFYFSKGDWGLDYVCTQFRDFTKISSFSRSFDNS